jgi:hypothetical protein
MRLGIFHSWFSEGLGELSGKVRQVPSSDREYQGAFLGVQGEGFPLEAFRQRQLRVVKEQAAKLLSITAAASRRLISRWSLSDSATTTAMGGSYVLVVNMVHP